MRDGGEAHRRAISAFAPRRSPATSRLREGRRRSSPPRRRSFGGADILINNAGTGSNETVMEAPDEKWQAYWDLHVMAAVRLARGLAPLMKARGGGVILHNASICAAQPLWYEPIYNTTKAALMMFSKCLSTELVGDNIRVNCVNPGPHPHTRLDQDRQAADGGQGRRLAGLPRRRRARERGDQALRQPRRSSPTSSSSCARNARAIRSARPISSMGAC